MTGAYPPTGKYDDLLMILARAEERRMSGKLPAKGRLGRALIEPGFNIFGKAVAAGLRLLPESSAADLQDKVFRGLLGGNLPCPFDEESGRLEEARALAAKARAAAGTEPALLCLASHPPAYGELLYLNVELMRHALIALRRLRGGRGRPKLVIGMDYFALDMLALYEEGAYAGFTASYHLGFDRLSHLRKGPGGFLLGAAGWPRAAGRIFGELGRGGEVGMVLGGGVPATSRLFYCAREFMVRLYRERPMRSSPEAIRAALAEEESFRSFLESGEVGKGLERSVRRALEAWFLRELSRGEGLEAVDEGRLTYAGRRAAGVCARALGYGDAETEGRLDEFAREFARETPYRVRFFRSLARTAERSGRPVVVLPLTYGRPGEVRMRFGRPVCLLGGASGKMRRLGLDGGPEEGDGAAFCRDFVSEEFP